MLSQPAFMELEDRINLLAKAARAESNDRSILMLAAASYGARPMDESTIPTGFDPFAAALFESIIEGAYLVATADGVFDDQERKTFERVVTASCGGSIPPNHIANLVSDLGDQLAEDGLDRRVERLAEGIQRPEQAVEVLRIAALIAQVSDDVSDVERNVLTKIASACKLSGEAVDQALAEVQTTLKS